jgi:hypothetical protein
MQFLYNMEMTEFNKNLSALRLALIQGASKDELVDFAIENMDNPETLT